MIGTAIDTRNASTKSTTSKTNNKSGFLLRQAMESFELALSKTMKLHEESLQRCVAILRDAGSPVNWERSVPVKVNTAIAAMQHNVDRSLRFMDENAHRTVHLMEAAVVEMRQTVSLGASRTAISGAMP